MAERRERVGTPSGEKLEVGEHGRSAKDRSPYWQRYTSWLGQWDPERIGIATMLKMRTHPAIALAKHIIWAPLINAKWDIECADPQKRAFMKAAVKDIYMKLMLYSLPAIEFGFAAYTKQWDVRDLFDDSGEAVWTGEVKPVVVVNLKQLHPLTVEPVVENDEFKGIRQYGERIDVPYAMWITHARHEEWGSLWGFPLLKNVYKLWWSSMFRFGLRDRHVEDRISPPVVARYPPGQVELEDGTVVQNVDAALEMAKSIRAGESVALSSERWETETGRTGDLRWDVSFLAGGDNVKAFIDLDDHDDVRIMMGMLIPPQAVIQAKGGLGSQAVAEALGDLFWVSQYVRKQEIDQQLNQYLIDQLDRFNFGGEGPRARLVTSRFLKDDEEVVIQFLKTIVGRQDVNPELLLNLRAMVERAGLPLSEKFGEGDVVRPVL